MEIVDKKIKDYLDLVCSYIRNKDVHNEVSDELKEHIYEIYYEGIDRGLSKEASITKAIERMGDTYTLGHKLNKVHKAKPDYISLISVLIIASAGIASMFLGFEGPFNILSSVKALVIGSIIGVIIYCYDYRRLEKYSLHIYITTILITIMIWKISKPVNGMPDKVASVSTLITAAFLISISGLISKLDLNKIKNIILLFFMGFISMGILLMIPSRTLAILYVITLTCVFLMSSAKRIYKISMLIVQTIGVGMVFLHYNTAGFYTSYRLKTLIYPLGYEDFNFFFLKSTNLLKSAGLFGKEISMHKVTAAQMQTDFAFSSMVYSLGWIVSIIVLVAIGLFIVRNLFLAKKIKNDFGRYIVVSIIIFMFMQFVTSILSAFGLVDFNYSMPFISYGGANLASNIIIIGLLMSIYRRKNLKSFISVNL